MKVIRCEVCGSFLYSVNDDGLLKMVCGTVRNIDGVCECGHGFHYSVTDRLLERIIERYNEHKANIA
jgi:hypothetical protein